MAWSRPDGVRGGHLDLAAELKRLDGKGYKAYKDLGGGWELPLETSTAKISCILFMDHVQGDPYAAPSRMRLRISRKDSAIPTETTANRARRVALEDYLKRVAERVGRSGCMTLGLWCVGVASRSSSVFLLCKIPTVSALRTGLDPPLRRRTSW